ncbi:hypothetical protein Slit_2041 [Sideroxydans lithotrophicus ES-1]|uniref:Uncharacterized protein n=1 Tax=Sideroxydans lithotrophicus (strain ES-1) TaxID=580332 RepID=D5CTV7_SIDLE|nr:hypothetical protein Slit_2041 [Sideroxydans lithotrophicus ES-1]
MDTTLKSSHGKTWLADDGNFYTELGALAVDLLLISFLLV